MSKKGFETAKIFNFSDSVDYSEGAIVSKMVLKKESGNISLFAFDKGEGLSEHTTPFDALVQIVDGKADIIIDGHSHILETGNSIIMPATIPHALKAVEQFKMVLTMIKSQ
jgi:quercetin dioxygenase-like cupin family protein